MTLPAAPEQSYCAGEVRRHDWDRFICTLFAPAGRRPALFALLAFNLEIARTRSVVSERVLGEIRLQWWRDAIAALYGGDIAALRHPVVEALKPAIDTYGLDRSALDAMIDARSDEFDRDPAAGIEELREHAHASEANLVKLQMAVLAPDAKARQPADDVAVAWTAAALVRNGRAGAGFAEVGREHLAAVRAARRAIDRRTLPALLPAAIAELYLRGKQPGRLRRQFAVSLAAWRGGP